MVLNIYQKKRNFNKTPEPKGKIKVKGLKKAIFVVQEHWASHHHFDFRLEIDGVLKSWAIPKNLPQKPREKRLAVQVEDHPLEYGSFEGKIPEGQYGAGKVKIWDKGEVTFKRLEKNLLEFKLEGEKLSGNFTLLKPEKFEEKNWLLIRNL